MGYMNFNFGLLVAEDFSVTDPKIRHADIVRCYKALTTTNETSKTVHLAPGQSTDLAMTARSLGLSATSQLQFSFPRAGEDYVRMSWTSVGSNPNFRIKRNLAIDATTTISISRVSPNSARIQSVAGTALDSSAVQVGDTLKFESNTVTFTSPFSAFNAGKTFKVQAKGSGYVDVIDNGVISLDSSILLDTSFDMALRVFSNGPVSVGDTVNILGATINASNKGQFVVTDVSPDYVEYLNPFGVTETIINTDNTIVIYDYLVGFLNLRSSGAFTIRVNGTGTFDVGMINQEDAVFMGSVNAWHIEAINNSQVDVNVTFQTVSLVG